MDDLSSNICQAFRVYTCNIAKQRRWLIFITIRAIRGYFVTTFFSRRADHAMRFKHRINEESKHFPPFALAGFKSSFQIVDRFGRMVSATNITDDRTTSIRACCHHRPSSSTHRCLRFQAPLLLNTSQS
ncbi:hypothetical protein CLOM_g2278 [Closterium sp. NIES-68]|nr:hypothetical protein CLOM_g2278 [Closterium sp. NIES-68]GJP84079.1 hypothetical protein CLOP_g14169 [Closterium sp. NIES-67]